MLSPAVSRLNPCPGQGTKVTQWYLSWRMNDVLPSKIHGMLAERERDNGLYVESMLAVVGIPILPHLKLITCPHLVLRLYQVEI